MYKIVIADDDSRFLEQFYKITDWERFNMEVVGSFENGEKVIEYVKNHSVDAIITDISMPGITGVDIAKYVYENYPDIKVMFFSAYKSFNYAYEAFDYGVIGYIVKPISFSELYKNLEKLKKILQEKNSIGFLSDELIEKRCDFAINFFCSGEVYETALKRMIGKASLPNEIFYMNCCIITFKMTDYEKYITEVWKYGKEALYDAFKRISSYESNNHLCIPLNIIDSDITLLMVAKKQSIKLEDNIKALEFKLSEAISVELLLDEVQFADSLFSMKRMLKEKNTPYFTKVSKMIFKLSGEVPEDIKQYKKRIEEYIEENCFKDISRTDIAEEFHMNASAFSRFFKLNFGEKFIDYLNKVRMEKVRQMILNGEENIKELYKKAGYKSESHFYKMFKYYNGITPAEYRNTVLQEQNNEDKNNI